HQPASFRKLATGIDRRYRVARSQREKLYATANEQRIWDDQKCSNSLLDKGRKGRVEVTSGAYGEEFDLPPSGLSVCEGAPRCRRSSRITWIEEHGEARGCWQQLVQEREPLGRKLHVHRDDTGHVAAGPIEAGDQTGLDRVVASAEDDRNGCGRG